MLTQNGFTCELVRNENDAVNRLSNSLRTIVADINLNEAGGSRTGGILLARKLAEMNRKIPIILISADPWNYLPPMNSPVFRAMQKDLCIFSVIDRNSDAFYNELVKTLQKTTSES